MFVTGKGGVGKSTVATALGLLAARRGLRTIVAELASQQRVGQAFDRQGDRYGELQLAPNLFTISIDPEDAMREYLQLKAGAFGHLLNSSRLFHAFALATPGMREMCSVGKVWELAQLERQTHGAAPYDFVVVDAPATGHGVGILHTPRTFSDIARVGPVARQSSKIATTIADREFTGVVAVATPEEMAINETFVLRDALAEDQLHLDLVIVNAVYGRRFDESDTARLSGALAGARSPLERTALRAALSEHARVESQDEQRARLDGGIDAGVIELPYLFADHVGRAELEVLADALETGLEQVAEARVRS